MITTKVVIGSNFLLRCILACYFMAYTHPDMLFQSQEIAARDVLGTDIKLPWEFKQNSACRSALQPILLGYVPLYILKVLNQHENKWALIALPRIFTAILSLAGDISFWKISEKHFFRDSQLMLLMYLASGAVTTYSISTFSNTIELIILLICMYMVEERRMLFLGVFAALGTWIRFTFPLFIAPFAVARLFSSVKVKKLSITIISGLLTAAALIGLDSWYFGKLVITPLNSFLFNVQSENVKQFGVTPYHLHLTGNAPFLFGPVYLSFIVGVFHTRKKTNFQLACFASSLVGFIALSTSIHQEWRFLLPLAPLFIFWIGPEVTTSKCFIIVFVIHSILLIVALGHAEKSVTAMIYINTLDPTPSELIFYNVIPIPKMLLPCNAEMTEVTSLQEMKPSNISRTLLVSTIRVKDWTPMKTFWPHVNLLDLNQEWNLYIYKVIKH